MLQTQAARGLKWQMIELGGRHLVSLFVFTALARMLDATSFGLVAVVGLYLAFLGIINEQGLLTALIQRVHLERDHLNSAFWFICGNALLLCGATIALARPIAELFKEPRVASLLTWASLTLVVDASARIHAALFMKNMNLRAPAVRTLLANSIGGVVGVTMAVRGYGVWALVGQQLTASMTGASFLWLSLDWRPELRFSLRHLKELLGVGSAVSLTAVIRFLSGGTDRVCIARFLGSAVLGQYAIAGKLVDLMCAALYQPVVAVSLPALATLQKDAYRYMNAVYKGMALNAIVSFPALIGLSVVAPDAVPVIFGAQWHAAAPILQMLALYILVQGVQVFFHPMLLSLERPKAFLILNAIHAAGGVIACVVGVRFGVRGIIVSQMLNSVLVGAIIFVYLLRHMPINVGAFWKPCLWPAVAGLFMVLATVVVRSELSDMPPLIRLLAQVASGAAVYCGIVAFFARGDVGFTVSFLRRAVDRSNAGPTAVPVPA